MNANYMGEAFGCPTGSAPVPLVSGSTKCQAYRLGLALDSWIDLSESHVRPFNRLVMRTSSLIEYLVYLLDSVLGTF